MIDHIAQAQGVLMNTIQSKALIGIGSHSVDFFFSVVPPYFFSFLFFFVIGLLSAVMIRLMFSCLFRFFV